MSLKLFKQTVLLLFLFSFTGCQKDNYGIHFIDVGYGDSVLLNSPGSVVLIDAGSEKEGGRVADYLKSSGVKEIDLFILTHPHPDHAGGFMKVAEKFKIDKILTERPLSYTVEYSTISAYVKENNIPAGILKRGDTLKEEDILIEVLNPEILTKELNDSSLVLKATAMKTSLLLAGDIGTRRASKLTDIYGKKLESRILKVPHHGKSGRKDFVEAVNPRLAVISVGPSRWGGPSNEIIDIYRELKIEVLRTDQAGDIVIVPSSVRK